MPPTQSSCQCQNCLLGKVLSSLIDGVEDQTCTASQNGCTGPDWNNIIPSLLSSFATLQRIHRQEQNRQSSDKVSTESSSSNSSLPPVAVVQQNEQSNIVAQKQTTTKKVSPSSELPAAPTATKSPKRKTVYDEVERSDRSADGSLRNSPKRIKIGTHENNNTATTAAKKLPVVAENNSTGDGLSKDYPSKLVHAIFGVI